MARAGARPGQEAAGDGLIARILSLGDELVEELVTHRVCFLWADDPAFPGLLSGMPESLRPHWLFVRGDTGVLRRPQIAIVGTRDSSPLGEFLSRYAVSAARELGAPVVSGLARGIDTVAHD